VAFPAASRKAAFISCPRAFEATGAQGQVLAVTVSTTADYFALAAGISQRVFDSQTKSDPKSLTRNYVTIECDVDLAVIFGRTAALVTGANVPLISQVGTLTTGVYTPAAKTSWLIYSKQPTRFLLQEGSDLFLGFVASGAGTMRLYQSSSDLA
jgi:hypothetical protein